MVESSDDLFEFVAEGKTLSEVLQWIADDSKEERIRGFRREARKWFQGQWDQPSPGGALAELKALLEDSIPGWRSAPVSPGNSRKERPLSLFVGFKRQKLEGQTGLIKNQAQLRLTIDSVFSEEAIAQLLLSYGDWAEVDSVSAKSWVEGFDEWAQKFVSQSHGRKEGQKQRTPFGWKKNRTKKIAWISTSIALLPDIRVAQKRIRTLEFFVERTNAEFSLADLAADAWLEVVDRHIESATEFADLIAPISKRTSKRSKNAQTGAGFSERSGDTMSNTPKFPLNQILYGPPGTGKTYIAIEKAVEICDGVVSDDRKAVVERFQELKCDGRVDFVTFHQSYGYEEFVEGIRPILVGEQESTIEKGEVQYECRAGVFRRICEQKTASKPESDLSSVTVWKMSLGRHDRQNEAYVYESSINNNCILLGYGLDGDFSGHEDEDAVKNRFKELWPSSEIKSYPPRMVNYLKNTMKIGDLIVVSHGNNHFRAIGKVTGSYEPPVPGDTDYSQKRGVSWLRVFNPSLECHEIIDRAFSQQALYPLEPVKRDVLANLLSSSDSDDSASRVLIIDEINRGNISKILGEMITLLEQDKRQGAKNEIEVTLPYSGKPFSVPPNIHIIGTMNTADRSIAFLDTALRRRFEFKEMMPEIDKVEDKTGSKGVVNRVDVAQLLMTINSRIEYLFDRDHQIGHSYFLKIDSLKQLRSVFLNKIIPLVQEYFHEDWEKTCAVFGGKVNSKPKYGIFHSTKLEDVGGIERDDYEARYQYKINPTFLKIGEDELRPFFMSIINPESAESSD